MVPRPGAGRHQADGRRVELRSAPRTEKDPGSWAAHPPGSTTNHSRASSVGHTPRPAARRKGHIVSKIANSARVGRHHAYLPDRADRPTATPSRPTATPSNVLADNGSSVCGRKCQTGPGSPPRSRCKTTNTSMPYLSWDGYSGQVLPVVTNGRIGTPSAADQGLVPWGSGTVPGAPGIENRSQLDQVVDLDKSGHHTNSSRHRSAVQRHKIYPSGVHPTHRNCRARGGPWRGYCLIHTSQPAPRWLSALVAEKPYGPRWTA
jgi:hypothetical protein